MIWQDHIPRKLQDLYEIHDFHHAAAILANEFASEFTELCEALGKFRLTEIDVTTRGGNESSIPKKFSQLLRPLGWKEETLTAKVLLDDEEFTQDTHKVDYVKGRVAFDLEWNSKDQTFDRDLYAFRTFFEYKKISVAVLVTRSNDLDDWFESLGKIADKHGEYRTLKSKYGASTTHMGKLLPRLKSGRNGGCPVLVFGIKKALIKAVI